MNIWFQNESARQSRLRESLISSSVASLRSPLPIIIENEKNDENLSNSNFSVSLKSFEEQNQESENQEDNISKLKRKENLQNFKTGTFKNETSKSKFQNLSNFSHNDHEEKRNKSKKLKNEGERKIQNFRNSLFSSEVRNRSGREDSERQRQSSSNSSSSLYDSSSETSRSKKMLNSFSSSRFSNYSKDSKNKLKEALNKDKDKSKIFLEQEKIKKGGLCSSSSSSTNFENEGKKPDLKSSKATSNDSFFYREGDFSKQFSEWQKYESNVRKEVEGEYSDEEMEFPEHKGSNLHQNKTDTSEENNETNSSLDLSSSNITSHNPKQDKTTFHNNSHQIQKKNLGEKNEVSRQGISNKHYQNKSKLNLFETSRNLKNSLEWSTDKEENEESDHHIDLKRKNSNFESSRSSEIVPSNKPSRFSNFNKMDSANPNSNTANKSWNNNQSMHTNNSKRYLTTNRINDRREFIVSIIEYCSNEVGIACYNITTGEIKLTQVIERMTYLQTISTLERFYPQEIIFSNTLENTLLIKKLMTIFRRTSFKPVKRNLFDETKGYYIYTLRGNKNEHNPDHKFLSYAALHALLLTLEHSFEFTLTYSALNIKWHYLEEVLVIDSQTICDLEIFINKETKIVKKTFISNFKCLTDGGTRMLRANILQPLTDKNQIKQRFDLVENLLDEKNKGILEILIKELAKFKNYEPITAKFIQNPKCESIKSIKSYLNGIFILSRMCFELLNLEKKLESILKIEEKEKNSRHEYGFHDFILSSLVSKLKDVKLGEIRKLIEENFDQELLKSYDNEIGNIKKTDNKTNRVQKQSRDNFIFLFKIEKINDEFVEISRLTYSHTIEDILKTFEHIKSKSNPENNLKLLYNEFRGYYISSRSPKSNQIDLSHLSTLIEDDIIHINTKNQTVTFSSSILISLNNRLKENEHKLIYQSTELLLSTIKEIQKNIEILFEVNYWISMVDMVISFVMFVKNYKSTFNVSFCRPQFNGNLIEIEKLRTIWSMEKFNKLSSEISLSLNSSSSALVIQKEINSSDQLNILYSFGYLTILSQIGCLVPAQSFNTQIFEMLMSKMEVESNLENKMSKFQSELVSLKNILENISKKNAEIRNCRCLVLIDEIIKGTQPEEESAISLAAMDEIIDEKPLSQEGNHSNFNCNVSVILVSHSKLFKMFGQNPKVSLCEFTEDGGDFEEKDAKKIINEKEKSILGLFEKYNYGDNFQKIYKGINIEAQEHF